MKLKSVREIELLEIVLCFCSNSSLSAQLAAFFPVSFAHAQIELLQRLKQQPQRALLLLSDCSTVNCI
jgi:hypothetical protein